MSQILSMLVKDKTNEASRSETSSYTADDSRSNLTDVSNSKISTNKKSKTNFIEKNKELVTRLSSKSKPNDKSQNDLVIKCLNEIVNTETDKNKQNTTTTTQNSNKIHKSKTTLTVKKSLNNSNNRSNSFNSIEKHSVNQNLDESSNRVEFDISIISNHSSIITNPNSKTKSNLDLEDLEKKNEENFYKSQIDDQQKYEINLKKNPNNIEIEIINENDSSLEKHEFVNKNLETDKETERHDLEEFEKKDQVRQLRSSLEKLRTELAEINNKSSIDPQSDLLNEEERCLIQGDQYEPISNPIINSRLVEDDDVNIIKFDPEKSKLRSQFMQRFGSASQTKKRQIIPNIIDSYERNSQSSGGDQINRFKATTDSSPLTTNTFQSTPSTLQLNNHHNLARFGLNPDQLTTASIMASVAAMNAVTQPLAKIQNDLEVKIANVMKELESLRKSDEKLSAKLSAAKKKNDSSNSEMPDSGHADDDESNENSNYETINSESDYRIKYLEKLQDKQFDLMSQLINAIGKENKNADLVVNQGKESLSKFKKQFEISEPFINDEPSSSENFVKSQSASSFKSSVKSGKSTRKSQPNSRANSRSRSRTRSGGRTRTRTRSNNNKNNNNNIRKYTSTSSRSNSRSLSRSRTRSKHEHHRTNNLTGSKKSLENIDLEFESEYGCFQCHLDRKSRTTSPKNRKNFEEKKKPEFLQELLDHAKSPNTSKNLENKSTTSITSLKSNKTASTFNIRDEQPTLFDKYLNETKQLSKLYEQLNNESSTFDKQASNSANKITDEASTLKQNQIEADRKLSMFSDIKEVLKAVEHSKSQIELSLAELMRERDNKMFYLLNSNNEDESERVRIKRLVDGCINAISNDVQREVTQKLIDESKHIKLEAERDVPASGRQFARNQIPNRYQTKLANNNNKNPLNQLRSTSANDMAKKTKTISDTNKYIGKIFGKSLLDEIKAEQLEEKNKQLKQQLDQQKPTQHQSRLFKNISNKTQLNKNLKETPKADLKHHADIKQTKQTQLLLDPQRPAFTTSQFKPYPENKMKSFSSANIQSNQDSNKSRSKSRESSSNVALITIMPRDQSPSKSSKDLKKQNLPSLSINPTSKVSEVPKSEPERQEIDQETKPITTNSNQLDKESKQALNLNDDDDDPSFDLNQRGRGIHLPGYKKPYEPEQTYDGNKFPPNVNITGLLADKNINQLSNETKNFVKTRDVLETKALDWLEQELMARFISKLANSEPHVHFANDDLDDESLKEELPDLKNIDFLSAIGKQGFQLFVDVGQPVDPDLIQVLVREVLEEKIASMIGRIDQSPEAPLTSEIIQPQPLPQPSPRKSLEFLEQQNKNQQLIFNVATPVPTPEASPVPSPRPALTPQVSVEKEKPTIQPQPHVPKTQPFILPYDPYEDSILEETLMEDDQVELELDIDPQLVEVPRTPVETPSHTPVHMPDTPSVSEVIPPLPAPKPPSPPPQAPSKTFVTKSVQCEPEPKSEHVIPQPRPQTPKQTKVIQIVNKDSTSSSSTTQDLTESTPYSSELSSTTHDTASDNDQDSYFSEGAWLMSKSEGQVIPLAHDAFVNLDLESAARSIMLNPRKNVKELNILNNTNGTGIQSDGEIKISSINPNNMFLYGGIQKPGVNRIIKSSEMGEVKLEPHSSPKYFSSEKSDGEIENGKSEGEAVFTLNKEQDIANTSTKSKYSEKKKKSKSKKPDKTIVDLKLSPQKSSKNNIKIQSMPNEIRIKDSNDFERRIFSSTPDTSMFVPPGVAQSNSILIDDEFLGGHDDENEKEVSIQIDHSNKKEKLNIKNDRNSKLPIQGSSDLYTEKDEDTLNNMTDTDN